MLNVQLILKRYLAKTKFTIKIAIILDKLAKK